jgi:argininosuccinate synthase
MNKKVVLAYSGGIDTVICIHWLQERGYEVIPVLAQMGQGYHLEPRGEKALGIGAATVHICDVQNRFAKEFILPLIKADATYESRYFLSSALSRPLIAEELVRVADEENCSVIAHGARSIGNEHIRLNKSIFALAPDVEILTPMKELDLKTVAEDLAYAKKNKLPAEHVRHTFYNIEENIWGVNIQLQAVTDSARESPHDTYIITTPLPETPDKPTLVEIGFTNGEPITLDGDNIELLDMINLLNKIAGRNAVGRTEMIENKITGEKSYEIHEEPAATVLYAAHRSLEELILYKELMHYKTALSQKYGELVYNGLWFSALRKGLAQFFEHIQQPMNGTVKLKLFKGTVSVVERKAR